MNCSFAHFLWATWANRSFVLSDLGDTLRVAHFFWSTWANRSFVLSDLSDTLTVAHFLWSTWAIRSRSLICLERSEQVAHSRSFDLSKMSNWANERWANERIPCPAKEQWERFALFHKWIALSLTKKTSESLEKPMSEFPTLNILDWSSDLHSAHHYYVQGGLTCTLNDPCVLFVFSDPCP